MARIFANLVLCSTFVFAAPLAAFAAAHATPMLHSGPATHGLAGAPKGAGAAGNSGLSPLPDGLCCSGLTVISPDTAMRAPIVPTAPGMPGQPAPIGTTTTLPNG
jgi:hypothetical protein